jgi:hypothetical protein
VLVAILSLFGAPLSAQRNMAPGPLFGLPSNVAQAEAPLDPSLPAGIRRNTSPRPASTERPACSLRAPVCVHVAAGGVSPALVHEYLAALELAHGQLVVALALPAPLPDHGLGATTALDLYLHADAGEDLEVLRDPALGARDRVSAHCRARARASGARRQAALCVAEASLLGLDAAEGDGVRRSVAVMLWRLLGAPSADDAVALDDFQANPQLSPLTRERARTSDGASLLVEYIDRQLGSGSPGLLPASIFSIGGGETPRDGARWHNEPDFADVLRQAFPSPEAFSDFALNFAVARAFIGSRDDGRRWPELLWSGDAGRVRFDWSVPSSTLPRRVAPLRPIEPLGAAYLWIDLDRVALNAALGFRAEWEAPVIFRFSVLALDSNGQLLQRYDLPYIENATQVERSIVDYQGADALLVVGTNLGGVDLAHPFDPDHEPWEPHGFTVYLAEI